MIEQLLRQLERMEITHFCEVIEQYRDYRGIRGRNTSHSGYGSSGYGNMGSGMGSGMGVGNYGVSYV